MIQKRTIFLPKGGELELEIRAGFYDKVRQHYGRPIDSEVTDDDIRLFIFGVTKSALDKNESNRLQNESTR